jgi:hypothetical protein
VVQTLGSYVKSPLQQLANLKTTFSVVQGCVYTVDMDLNDPSGGKKGKKKKKPCRVAADKKESRTKGRGERNLLWCLI